MQKVQESIFSVIKTTSLSSAVFSFLQPTGDFPDNILPLGGILHDTKYGWLALGPKFCVVDLRSGLKIAAWTFGSGLSSRITVTSVVEIPTPLTDNSQQLIISLECDETTGLICVFHINGSQLLRCIQTDVVITELAVCDGVSNGPLTCFDGLIMAGTRRGEIFVFDLNRASLIQALKDISEGNEHLVRNEENSANLIFLPQKAFHKVESQRELAVENDDHLGLLLNEHSFHEGQYIFLNPDGTVRMKAKQDHVRVTVVQYIPQLGSLAVGFNFGAFQIWNMLNLELEFTSQVNVECLPVTHFGFQEPCDDPRAFCYLWVIFSVVDMLEEEEYPLAVMYSLTYQGKRMQTESKSLYQDFLTATVRFQIELSAMEDVSQFIGGRCISCHTYSISSTLGEEGEDTMLNLCQLVWECWGETSTSPSHHGMLLFDLDQWYKDQMPATYQLESNAFMSTARCPEISRGTCQTLDLRLDPTSVSPYSHATRLEEHFYPNSLQYNCICLNTSEATTIHTVGVQRQILRSISASGPSCLLSPERLHTACRAAGLTPLYSDAHATFVPTPEEQRHFLLSVALEARLSRFLKRCAHDWATGTHSGVGCTLTFLIDWCWRRAIELKENAKELTAPLFTSANIPDRNVVRCLEHCVQQLTALTGLLDAVLTKCCNLVVPDALSEMEEKYKGIGIVSLYFQVVQWFVRVGLLPERLHSYNALPYPAPQLYATYKKRRIKLHRLQDKSDEDVVNKSCPLLYIDQLIEHEFGGERVHHMWLKGGSECEGLYPPPSLYSLLRLYLLPDIALEHKHSLLLYLLLDYSMLYDDIRYEVVIRRLMQFPTMFGLSNTAIKATQAFWHLDHRDFDFALDQLQCLTGNTLSDWQHHVVLSSLLAQKKTQAALQYLHVKKPPPVQHNKDGEDCMNDQDKLEDWQSCCSLYLARGLVFEALDVIRMCVQHAGSVEDKVYLLNFFYKGCRNTGQLSKVLQMTLLPFEEDVFIKYLQDCNESQTSELLVMYYLQQARYLEAEQYNSKIKIKGRPKDVTMSVESILDVLDREGTRDTMVEVVCSALPTIANTVARCALTDFEPHLVKLKPMSVYVQAQSPKNTFTYKSSFIQDTIENASETWINKPQLKRGLKRALEIEETPFICTPKIYKTKSLLMDQKGTEATPPKRAKLDLSGTPRTPKMSCSLKVSETLSKEMASLLDMPEVQTPHKHYERSGAETPQSILKNRRIEDQDRDAPSPADSRYIPDSDEELETASNHTHYSDSTNKHLRFIIPTASEGGSTPSPVAVPIKKEPQESSEMGDENHGNSDNETHLMESPPKKLAVEGIKCRKSYKDNVRARRSLSISANSSLSDDPNTSIESIADIPITLINPRYSGEKRQRSCSDNSGHSKTDMENDLKEVSPEIKIEIKYEEKQDIMDSSAESAIVPRTPKARRGIRSVAQESTPVLCRSRAATPERVDSPIVTPLRSKLSRSRSRTPELSPRSSSLPPIPEQPKQEVESEPHPKATTLSVPRQLRSRSRTPERSEKTLKESQRLEAIKESPIKPTESAQPEIPKRNLRSRSRTPDVSKVVEEPIPSPRSLRSRSRTPDVEIISNQAVVVSPRSLRSRSRTPEVEAFPEKPAVPSSPRSLRSRSKTPEKLMSPKKEHATRNKKSLSRMVLEANTFAKTKQQEKMETEEIEETIENVIECTPMKLSKEVSCLMDVNFSPIVNKSVLHSSTESFLSVTSEKINETANHSDNKVMKPLPAFDTINSYFENSVLQSCESSAVETSSIQVDKRIAEATAVTQTELNLSILANIDEDFQKSVLQSAESSVVASSNDEDNSFHVGVEVDKIEEVSFQLSESELDKSVLGSCESSIIVETDETHGKENKKIGDTYQEVSSIMTSDSEMEVKDNNWKSQVETPEKARVIQKEKESIVEIEREINEIEEEMSDDCGAETDSGEEESSENEEDGESTGEEESESENEIISIDDSDESSDTNKLEIIDIHVSPDLMKVDENKEPVELEEIILSKEPIMENMQMYEKVDLNKDESADIHVPSELMKVDDDKESLELEEIILSEEQITQHLQMNEKVDENKDQSAEVHVSSELMKADENKEPVELREIILMNEKVNENKDAVMESVSTEEHFKTANPDEELKENRKEVVLESLLCNESTTNQLDQAHVLSLLTDDSSVIESDNSINLNYSEEQKTEDVINKENTEVVMETDQLLRILDPPAAEINKNNSNDAKDIDIVDANFSINEFQGMEVDYQVAIKEQGDSENTEKEKPKNEDKLETRGESTKLEEIMDETEKTNLPIKPTTSVSSIETVDEDKQEVGPISPTIREQTQTTTFNSDATPLVNVEIKKAKTPSSRRGSKTPTSGVVRKILTRRTSKQLAEIGADMSLFLEDALTPKRRATRSKNKEKDNDVNLTSDTSVESDISKLGGDTGDGKGQMRKNRVSLLRTDLTAIPEMIPEELKGGFIEHTTEDDGNTKGGTRHQEVALDSLLELKSSRIGRRRPSAASRSKVEDDDASFQQSTLDKEGYPETDDLRASPEPPVATKPLARLARAASESRASPKPVKTSRRISVDVASVLESEAPASRVRGRRASFTRACEALHTPKGRRASTDLKGDQTSQPSSPAAEEHTPRRGRRPSTSTQTKPETSKKSRKNAADKSKETNE